MTPPTFDHTQHGKCDNLHTQVTMEEQMTRQEEELLARIANLEQSATEGKSKNKKSK